jgi:hypothetical protein
MATFANPRSGDSSTPLGSPTGNPTRNSTGPLPAAPNATPCTSACPQWLSAPPPISTAKSSTDKPASYGGTYIYWVGAYYSGTSTTSSKIQTSITTPSSGPRSGDEYYLLLSTYDSAGSYDQLGIGSSYNSPDGGGPSTDTWEVTYSYTNIGSCPFQYQTQIDAGALSPFTTYTYQMVLTGTDLEFNVFTGTDYTSGTPTYSYSVADTASSFEIATSYSECSNTWQDTTDYEEVHYISSTSSMEYPQWNFNFLYTYYGSTLISSAWSTFGVQGAYLNPPSTAWVYHVDYPNSSTGEVQIANEPFSLYYANDKISVAPGSWSDNSGSLNVAGSYCNTGNSQCDPTSTVCSLPSGWSWGYNYPGTVPASVFFDFQPPSSASGGLYYLGCTVTIPASSAFDNYLFYVTVT